MKQHVAFLVAATLSHTLWAFECTTSYEAPPGFVIDYDLGMQPDPHFSTGCKIHVGPNHEGWGYNQQPNQFTQVGVKIPQDAVSVQISSYPYYNAQAMYAYVQCNRLYFALQYWDAAFNLLLAWKIPGANVTHPVIDICDANVYTPPFPGKNCVANDFAISADVTKKRLPGYHFCFCNMDLDHRGFSANQPAEEWSRIRARIPKGAIAAQVTSFGADGKNTSGLYSYIMNATSNCNELDVALQYWYSPWKLWIGYMFAVNRTIDSDESECDAYVYNAPHV